MARLTLTFKGKTLLVIPIEAGEVGIGRDSDNTMAIDSLAIAPRHATVHADADGLVIRQLDQNHPLFVNNRKVSEHRLKHGDRIAIGKHEIFFTDDELIPQNWTEPPPQEQEAAIETNAAKPAHHVPDASLQVLKGKNIGLVIPLRSGLTRLGKDDTGSAVIVRRKDGYFLSALAAADAVQINDAPINEQSVRLNHGDIVKVNQHLMQFFCEAAV